MDSSDAKAGRFIPRDALASFVAWQPGALGADACAAAEPDAAQLNAARQAGYQDGYRDGLAALDAFKRSFVRSCGERIDALAAGFDAELLQLEQRLAAAVAELALQLARQVVRSELGTRPQLVAQVAREALAAMLPGARALRLYVHPDDQPLLADAADALAARGVTLIADAALERGGCRVESDVAFVDATLATRWARACATIGLDPPGEDEAAR